MHKYYKSLVLFACLIMISFTKSSIQYDFCETISCFSATIVNDSIISIDHYDTEDGYYTFLREDATPQELKSVVLFVHGYGALNPAIFGAWIKHLVKDGNIVIYPRYQKNLFSPSTNKFTSNTLTALFDAVEELGTMGFNNFPMVYIGHSFGGVIVSNLIGNFKENSIMIPQGVLIAEGGAGPFKKAMLNNYKNVPPEVPFLVVVGSEDQTVGSFFGKKLFSEIPDNVENHFILQQPIMLSDSVEITASHYEPYSYDDWCDNGTCNFTYKRAMKFGKLDILNTKGYWNWLDLLISRGQKNSTRPISKVDLVSSLKQEIGDKVSNLLSIYSKQDWVGLVNQEQDSILDP